MTHPTSQTCERMLALLTTDTDNTNITGFERAIEAHIATCPVCTTGEQALRTLITAYCRTEVLLTEDFEQRLLAQMCNARYL